MPKERADRVKVICVYCDKKLNKDSMRAHVLSAHPGQRYTFREVGVPDYSKHFKTLLAPFQPAVKTLEQKLKVAETKLLSKDLLKPLKQTDQILAGNTKDATEKSGQQLATAAKTGSAVPPAPVCRLPQLAKYRSIFETTDPDTKKAPASESLGPNASLDQHSYTKLEADPLSKAKLATYRSIFETADPDIKKATASQLLCPNVSVNTYPSTELEADPLSKAKLDKDVVVELDKSFGDNQDAPTTTTTASMQKQKDITKIFSVQEVAKFLRI